MKRPYEDFAYTDGPRANCAWGMERDWPRVSGDMDVDIAIIGAGYTGLNAALTLAQAGHSPVVLEAQAPGWGASGRNGGFCCLGGSAIDDKAMVRHYGAAGCEDFRRLEIAAIDHVSTLLDRHGIDAQRHSMGELYLAHSPKRLAGFGTLAEGHRARGLQAQVWDKATLEAQGLSSPAFHGGLHVAKGFALDPGAYAMGLAKVAKEAGAKIYGQSPVTQIAKVADKHHLTTPDGVVRASRILLATNGYSADDLPPWLRGRFLPAQSAVMMTRKMSRAELEAQGWTSDLMAYDSRALLHYFRLLPDGRFLFGMRGGIGASPRIEARARARLIRDFRAHFPAWAHVDVPHSWSGMVNLMAGLVPYIGPMDGDGSALMAMGYHGNGVAMGSLAGHMAAQLLMGEDLRPTVMCKTPARFPVPAIRRMGLRLSFPLMKVADRF